MTAFRNTGSMSRRNRKPKPREAAQTKAARPPSAQRRTAAHPPTTSLPVRHLDRLGHLLYNDLDQQRCGLPWLAADTATRILLSDHLIATVETLGQNLTASEHHLAGYESAVIKIDGLTLRSWQKSLRHGVRPPVIAPPSKSRDESLCARDCHVAGFFRAVGSVFDNTAVAVAVLAALPVDIVERFTWGSLRSAFDRARKSSNPSWDQEAIDLWIQAAKRGAGPIGWLEWAVSMRNMLVHRPRRVWTARVVPDPPNGFPRRLRTSFLLPREPELTTVEVMRDAVGLNDSLLREDAFVTMSGILESTKKFTEAVCAYLFSLAEKRRQTPGLLAQPPEQWRDKSVLPRIPKDYFEGYMPMSVESLAQGDSLNTSGSLTRRMAAAAIMDGRRDRWPEWLAEAQRART